MAKELTVMEATRKLRVSVDAVYKLICAAKLPARKYQGRWLIPSEAVEARLKTRSHRNGKN
jgi:excisionase family DNA binding protein